MDYAIIRLGGKQYRVREGETLVVDRVKTDEGGTFSPEVLLGDNGVAVTATVVAHERGPKIRIGKVKRRTGYRRHNGFRAATTRIQISLGGYAGLAIGWVEGIEIDFMGLVAGIDVRRPALKIPAWGRIGMDPIVW